MLGRFFLRILKGIRSIFDIILDLVDALFNEHKLVRRLVVLFVVYEIHYAVQESLPRLNDGDLVMALLGIIAMLATVLAFYITDRNTDDKQ